MWVDWFTTGALLVLAAWLLWKYLSWNHNHWQKLGVACPEPSVPFGNVKEMLLGKKAMGIAMADIYHQMEGQPFCGYYNKRQPALLLRDADLVRKILVKDFASFHDNDLFFDMPDIPGVEPLINKNPFFLTGAAWKKMRSLLTPSFTTSRLKPMFPMMRETADGLVQLLKRESLQSNSDGLDMGSMCMRYTMDVVSSCALGIKAGSLENEKTEMVRMLGLLMHPPLWDILKFSLVSLFPGLHGLLKMRLGAEEFDAYICGLVSQLVAQREQEGLRRDDFLQMMSALKTKGDDTSFTDVDIAGQVVTFMLDGIHTSGNAMAFVLYELALNPDIQDRLRRELEETVDMHGGQLCYEAIQEATYLHMVILEALRLHPPVGVIQKKCTAPYELTTPSGRSLTLQPGDRVHIAPYGMNSDPRYFPSPDVFDPERHSTDNKDHTSTQAFMPFGAGPRTCLGQRFALWQLKVGLAAVVMHLELLRTARTPTTVDLDKGTIVSSCRTGLWVGIRALRTV